MDRRRRIATLAAVLGGLAAPTAADAAVRYAEPGGDGPEPCLQADPCGIHHATVGHVSSDVQTGDEIILLPGDYSVAQTVNLLDPDLAIHGQAGQPRPRIVSTASTGLFTNQTGAEISRLEVEQSGTSSALATSSGSSVTIEGVRVHTFSPTNFSFTCQLAGTVTIRNSICWSSGAAGAAIGINSSGGTAALTLRNVTAVSTATTNSYGIYYGANLAGTALSATATNLIADGATADVAAVATNGGTSSITLEHSNYATESEQGSGTVTNPGSASNQTAAPVFSDAATGGFHQAASSPTINQGVNDGANGTFDIDDEARIFNTTTDIGADEFVIADGDGDGVPNGPDDCLAGDTLWTSNASTDHDADGCRDAGEDTDDDKDGKSDTADSCATGSLGWTSTSITDVDSDGCRDSVEDADDDNDTVADASDNCPVDANTSQTNTDGDAQGNACDPDDDNDTKADNVDGCAAGDTGWTSDTATDADADGCRDAGEDADDDNDAVADTADDCSPGATGWTSNGGTDADSDGCRDMDEDSDDDNDAVADTTDDCSPGATGWTSSAGTDADSDGCRDADEDSDDDNDTVADTTDNCPVDSNTGQANNDGDAQGDVCDSDDDNDTVADTTDNCPVDVGSPANSGCPPGPPPADSTAPETTMTKKPKRKTTKTKAKFAFRSDDADATFECRLDKAGFKPCTSPRKVKRLDPGKHVFQVRATDAAGNMDVTPAKHRWKVVE